MVLLIKRGVKPIAAPTSAACSTALQLRCFVTVSRENKWGFGHWVALVLVCYFIPFGAVYLDEEVFETNWYWTLGPEAVSVFQAVYGPFIDLVNYLERAQ